MSRIPLHKIDGILLLNKPLQLTSNHALQRVKRLFGAKKAGHTGSLDPLATGMLPICFGEATKFSQFLLESDKHYQVTMKLGIKTTTGDAEGEVIATKSVPPLCSEALSTLLNKFKGEIEQIPPMFSAIKFQGKPLYELARQGIEIERQPRKVTIHDCRLDHFEKDSITLSIHCSKGTYVRTLVEDLGEELGCGAYVSGLYRSSVVPYDETKMQTLESLETLQAESGPGALQQFLLPLETSVQSFPAMRLTNSAVFYIRMGQPVMVPNFPTEGYVRLYAENDRFLGVGEIMSDGRVAPRRLVNNI